MNLLEAVLHRVADDLAALGVSWAVVGGFAVSARAEPRFTRDVDVAVAVAGDDEAEATISRLTARGYRLIAMTEQDAVGRLATVRLVPTGTGDEGDIVVDVLFASSGIEPEIAAAAEAVELVPGLVVPVAQIGHLIALKLLARDDESRPQDRVDLLALRDAAGAADLDIAAEGVEQIRDRGFDRGRDLSSALSALLTGRSDET
jgi:predicted nucleotidyltransferase